MIEKFCWFLTNKIRKEMLDVDDERAEVINYGLQLIIGEIPKMLITIFIAYLLGIFKLTVFTILVILPYRAFSGGFHLKTHLGCILFTNLYYCGIAKISNYFILHNPMKLIFILCAWIFGMIMIKLYAPADTENVPILRKNERRQKQILSYVTLTIALVVAAIVNNSVISNIIILGYFVQSITITRFAYKLTKNKYGYEVYANNASETLA